MDFTNNNEVTILFNNILFQYINFLEDNRVEDYEFILIAPAWYIDKKQIKKFKTYYSSSDYENLEKNYSFYKQNMKTQIANFKEILLKKNIINIFIDDINLGKNDLFQVNNYHLSKIGHEEIAKDY